MIYIYTNETCPYCKAVKEELSKNNIEFNELLTKDHVDSYNNMVSITGLPTVPSIEYKNNYFLPGRDFRSAQHLVEVINNYKEPDTTTERIILEKLKTLNYNIHMAFVRTDKILTQIENKINKDND